MILQRVSPVTHSVGNCVKRVVVIVSSVLFFRTPVSPINSLGIGDDTKKKKKVKMVDLDRFLTCLFVGVGTGIALAGVFLYSRVKRIKPNSKTA